MAKKTSALQWEHFPTRRQLGRQLIKAGLIPEAALEQTLASQQEDGEVRLSRALVKTGGLTAKEAACALAEQLGMPFLTLDRVHPQPAVIAMVPAGIARSHLVVPVLKIKGTLLLAVADPLATGMREALQNTVDAKLRLAVAPEDEIVQAVRMHYGYSFSDASGPQDGEKEPPPNSAGKEAGKESRQRKLHGQPDEAGRWSWPPRMRAASAGTGLDIFGISTGKGPAGGVQKKEAGFEGALMGVSESLRPKAEAEAGSGGEEGLEPASADHEAAVLHFENGLAAARKGDYQEALREFESALRLDPENRVCRANIQRIKSIVARKEP
jgi:tetratricopeptide (TPR) repeat protein